MEDELARLFVIIGSLVVLALTAALVAPYFIDWASYKADFEREAGRVLGREVRVEGTARAWLLPFPSVTFTDVVVAGAQPGEPAMTVDEFSMDAELAPFLRGELLIFDMRLVRPNMRIEIGQNGRINWAVRPSSPFNPRQVTLENVTITDGAISINQQASGRTIEIADIDSTLSARSLAGPWRVGGTLSLNGVPLSLTASTGALGADGSLRVRISAEPHDYPFNLITEGEARFEGEQGLYSGTFRLHTLQPAASGEGREIAEAGNRVSGRFALDHRRLAIDEFRFATGSEEELYTAEGQAAIELGANPSFSITADGAQIRLDGSEAIGEAVSSLSADERLAALRRFVADLPKPAIPGTIAVTLPAIIVGDTTIRNIRVEAQPAADGWDIASVAATLPGRTHFEGQGMLSTGEPLSFDGAIVLAVNQPSGFAAWLARDVDEAIRALPAAGFSADVVLTGEHQSFDKLELILGDALFRGDIERHSPAGVRPSLMLSLRGDRLDVEGMRAFASLFVDEAGHNRLAGHDVDLEIAAGPVSAGGLTAERLDTALRLREGALEIDRLTVSGLAGANISATGHLDDIAGDPTGQVDATVIAVDLEPLVDMLARRFSENRLLAALDRNAELYPGLLSDSEIDIIASAAADGGGRSGVAVSASGTSGGTDFGFSLSSEGSPPDISSAHTQARFSAHNDEAVTLYALLGLPALPLGMTGGAEISFSATGIPMQEMETMVSVSGTALNAGFDGALTLGNGGSAVGDVRLESEDLEPWLATAGVSLPGFGYGLPAELTARIDYSDGAAALSGIAGTVAGSSIRGDLEGQIRDGRPHLAGTLALEDLDLGLGAEMMFGSSALQSEGDAWAQGPFRQNINAPFSADVTLAADRLWVGNAGPAGEARFDLSFGPEGMSVSDLSARFRGGSLEGLAEMRNDGGTGLFSSQFSLRDAPLQEVLPSAGLSGRADLSASLTASGKSVNGMVASLSGSGSAALEDLQVSGLDASALPSIIERADRLGVDVNAERVATFAPDLVRAGRFPAGDLEFAFTVANGTVRTPPVQLQSGNARMSVEATADLAERTVAAAGSITYDAGQDAVAGSDPTVRFSLRGAPGEVQPELDTGPLAQFLTQRALEREQARVEHMQAVLLEKQRLRREVRYYEAQAQERADRRARQAAQEAERARLRGMIERAQRAEEDRQRQQRENEARQGAEREEEPRPEGETDGSGPSPAGAGAAPQEEPGSAIEREPLPPPATGGERPRREEGTARTTVPTIDIEDLTVERLLELLDTPGE